MHRAGAQRVGDFDATHMLNSAHRATLQGWGEVKYPSEMTETKRRDLISQVVPPPFAAVLAEAVERTVKEETNRSKAEISLVQLKKAAGNSGSGSGWSRGCERRECGSSKGCGGVGCAGASRRWRDGE